MKIKNALLSTAAATASLFAIGATAQAATVTVKAGDTVSQIALDHNTTVDAIQQANHLKDVNLILVGQQLEVNGDDSATTTTTTTTTTTQTSQPAATTQSSSQTTNQASQSQTSQSSQTQSSQTQTSTPAAKTTTQQSTSSTSNYSNNSSESAAKAWIANKESGAHTQLVTANTSVSIN